MNLLPLILFLFSLSLICIENSTKYTTNHSFNYVISFDTKPKRTKHKLKHRELKVHWKQFIKNMDLKKKNPDALKIKTIIILA